MLEEKDLFGIWRSVSSREYGDIIVEFKPDGSLIYTILEDGKRQIINLRYWIEDDYLCTDQPSSPKLEKTALRMDGADLIFDNGRTPIAFTKVPPYQKQS